MDLHILNYFTPRILAYTIVTHLQNKHNLNINQLKNITSHSQEDKLLYDWFWAGTWNVIPVSKIKITIKIALHGYVDNTFDC